MAGKKAPVKKVAKQPPEKKNTRNKTPRPAADLKHRIKIQQALYEIADAASAVTDMQSFYKRLHEIVGGLMYAGNFFIASYDEQSGLLSFPYFVDEDEAQAPPTQPLADFHGLTSWVIRTGRMVTHGWDQSLELLESGEIRFPDAGTSNENGIAAPLKVGDKTIGVVFVQSHIKGIEYTDQDEKVLEFVARHIAITLTRARAIEETRQRNQEIAEVLEQQTATSGILRVIAESPTDVQPVLDAVAEYGARLSESVECAIFQVVSEDQMKLAAQAGPDRVYPIGMPWPLNHDSVAGSTILDRRIYHIPDIAETGDQFSISRSTHTKYRSFLGVPLTREGQCFGAIFIRRPMEGPFSEKQINLVKIFADQAVIAIENVRLFEETQHLLKETEDRAAELAVINSVQAALAAELDLQGIYNAVGDKIRSIFHNTDVSIRIYDPRTNFIHYPYTYVKGQPFPLASEPLPEIGFSTHILHTRETLVINENMAQEMEKYNSAYFPGAGSTKSVIIVPLVSGDQARGLIALFDQEREHAFSDSDVRLLETLTNSMSAALENARLFDETQQRNAELAIINSIQDGLVSKLEIQEIYELVGEKLQDVFKQTDLSIGVYDPETDLLSAPFVIEHGRRIPFPPLKVEGRGIVGHLLHDPKPLLFNTDVHANIEEIIGQNQSADITGSGFPKSALYVPLLMGGSMRGVIVLQDFQKEHAFSGSDIRLLDTLADSMSVALENARLWEQEKMYRKALQRELEIGREIQAGFLPEALPLIEGWEIAASLMSAREVAGDFYDVFDLPDGNIGLVIADVCDKGVGAALFMTLFRSLIRAAANLDYFEQTEQVAVPRSAVERLQRAISLTNNYIAETHGNSGMFATLFFGILDPRSGKLTYVNGGHEPPLIVQAGSVREALRKTGPAVGAIMNCGFDIVETQLFAGDMFFAFTDGVPDCQDPHGDFFGRERLLDILRSDSSSSQELIKCVETELHQYIGHATQFDDITLLAVKRANPI